MVLVYVVPSGQVESISGFRGTEIRKELVDSIRFVEPLSEGRAEYRIYDAQLMEKIWQAHEEGRAIRVLLDADGTPIGVHIEQGQAGGREGT